MVINLATIIATQLFSFFFLPYSNSFKHQPKMNDYENNARK